MRFSESWFWYRVRYGLVLIPLVLWTFLPFLVISFVLPFLVASQLDVGHWITWLFVAWTMGTMFGIMWLEARAPHGEGPLYRWLDLSMVFMEPCMDWVGFAPDESIRIKADRVERRARWKAELEEVLGEDSTIDVEKILVDSFDKD